MTNDEEPIELLMPSAAMQPVLSDLRAALVHLGDVKTRSAPRVWDNIDFEGTAANIARFTLWTEGWDEGVIPAGDVNAASDVGHRLSTELEIMSPDDLEERFRVIVDGAPVTRLYRRISDAQTVSRLMKDTMALGWSGFDMLALSPSRRRCAAGACSSTPSATTSTGRACAPSNSPRAPRFSRPRYTSRWSSPPTSNA